MGTFCDPDGVRRRVGSVAAEDETRCLARTRCGPDRAEEPARKLRNLKGIPIVMTAEASFASPGAPGAVAFLTTGGLHGGRTARLAAMVCTETGT